MSLVLGIDLGGSSLRVGLVDRAGTVHQLLARPHRVVAEMDPETWWADLCEMLRALDLSAVVGIGFSGIGRSQVFVDARARPLRPALCFPDGRAEAEAAELADIGRDGWAPMSPFHPLARLAWVKRHEPSVFAATAHVLQPKDWLAMRLTGVAVTDRIGNAWALEADGRTERAAVFADSGIPRGLWPAMLDPWQRVGLVRHWPALAGVPVFAGALDTWCATLGAGVDEGDGYVIAGTTDAAGMLTPAPIRLQGRVTLPWGEELFHTGGPSGAGGACLDWFAEVSGQRDAAAVAELASTAGPGPRPLFLPDLDGVRAPLWQAGARGAFLGLTGAHGPAELALSVLEGVALADAAVLHGLSPRRVVLAGGGARSDFWCSVRATILGVAVERAVAAEPGVVGAALSAWIGLGALPGLAAARRLAGCGRKVFPPDATRSARVARMQQLFAMARTSVLPLTNFLASLHTIC